MPQPDGAIGPAIAAAAAHLLGARFRLHGRNPATGLDCVGVVACAFAGAGISLELPQGYHLRNTSISGFVRMTEGSALRQAATPIKPGDVILVVPGPAQHHLLVAENGQSFIHAHASLRKVVRATGTLPWPIDMIWRFDRKFEPKEIRTWRR